MYIVSCIVYSDGDVKMVRSKNNGLYRRRQEYKTEVVLKSTI